MIASPKPQIDGFNDQWKSRIVEEGWADPERFLLNPRNHRIHPERQRKAMTGVLKGTGWVAKVTIQHGTDLVLDGHMRIEEAIRAGELVPYTALDLNDDEAEAMLFYFDPLGALAERDEDKYAALAARAEVDDNLRALLIEGMADLDEREAKARRRLRRGDPEATPEPPEIPVVRAGEIWTLGAHVLAIGDCRDLDLVARALGALGVEHCQMALTDPPYNANYVSRVDKDRAQPFGGIANDNLGDDEWEAFLDEALQTLAAILAPGASAYVTIDHDHYARAEAAFCRYLKKQDCIVWDKGHFGMGKYYRKQHELVIFGSRGDQPATWHAGHNERNVWDIARDPAQAYRHPTQKPVALAERAIKNSTNEGDVVADFFAGVGFTLIGAEATERRCLAVELEPRWAETIIRRWQDYADDEAVREDGVAFIDLLAE